MHTAELSTTEMLNILIQFNPVFILNSGSNVFDHSFLILLCSIFSNKHLFFLTIFLAILIAFDETRRILMEEEEKDNRGRKTEI